MRDSDPSRTYRTLFLSDFHLGMRGVQAEFLLGFLKDHDADTIYLIGDIVDGWRMCRNWYWPQAHNDVVRELLGRSHKGSRIVYIPGNHDEKLREYCGLSFGGIEVKRDDVYTLANGRKYLIMHGDEFDVVIRNAKWLALLGDWAYRTAIFLNTYFNFARRRMGFRYWSLSSWLKHRVKNIVNYIGDFEKNLSTEAARRSVDGVICGHIHHPANQTMKDGTHYLNTGDWVESCTALVEHRDGRLELIRWYDTQTEMAAGRLAANIARRAA